MPGRGVNVTLADSPSVDQPGVARVLQTRAQTRTFYDRLSSVYDFMAERTEAPVRRAALRRLALRPGENVLEIGCGTGPCLTAMANAVGSAGQVRGIDLSSGMLQHAEQRVRSAGHSDRVVLECADATCLPYPDRGFDAILMTFVLELFDTPEIPRVLAECGRVLRDDGRIVVAGVTKIGGGGTLLRVFEWTHRHFPAIMDCRPIFVARALEAAGFAEVEAAQMHCWVPVEVVRARSAANAKSRPRRK